MAKLIIKPAIKLAIKSISQKKYRLAIHFTNQAKKI